MEYWAEMTARHRRERLELVQSLAPSYCIKDAAKILDVPEPNLRRYAHHYGVTFQKKQYERETHDLEPVCRTAKTRRERNRIWPENA